MGSKGFKTPRDTTVNRQLLLPWGVLGGLADIPHRMGGGDTKGGDAENAKANASPTSGAFDVRSPTIELFRASIGDGKHHDNE